MNLVVLVALLPGGQSNAQSSGAPNPPSDAPRVVPGEEARTAQRTTPSLFRSGVDVVALDVCVKDRQGRLIPGLGPDDFIVLENNTPQELALFSPEGQVPLAVALLIDRSASMAGTRLEQAKAAGVAFLRSVSPEDLVEVIAFNERADRRFPLGTVGLEADQALADLSATGATGMFEAVLVALRDLAQAQRREATEYRYAIVVLSDGEDTISRLPFDDVLADVRRSGVIVYGISLRFDEKGRALPPLHELSQLANDSGGRVVSISGLEQLAPVYQEIAAELRHLYRLGYAPSNSQRDGAWRRISVRVLDNRDARVRTRAGYYAPRELRRFPAGRDE